MKYNVRHLGMPHRARLADDLESTLDLGRLLLKGRKNDTELTLLFLRTGTHSDLF